MLPLTVTVLTRIQTRARVESRDARQEYDITVSMRNPDISFAEQSPLH